MSGGRWRSGLRHAVLWGWIPFLLLALAGLGVVEPLAAQEAAGAGVVAQASDPLPVPSFQRAYLHVFLAFGIAWALLLGYVVLLNRRLGEAERDLERLRER